MSNPGQYLEKYTYEYLLEEALSYVPEDIDKRQGSIIFDAVSPFCYGLANTFEQFRYLLLETYVTTATGERLDLRVAEQGITRYPATYAVRKGVFTYEGGNPAVITIGSRFSTIVEADSVNYYVDSQYTDEDGNAVPGSYNLVCEVAGIVGNNYLGPLLPITNMNSLETATLSTVITPARDVETDDELRFRYFERLGAKAFGGNHTQYRQELKAILGVGDAQIYPTWNGGGTVKCSIVDASYNDVSTDFVNQVQEIMDPLQDGNGLGKAPIGHVVTITTPTRKVVNISAKVVTRSGYMLTQLQTAIETAIENYFKELREDWAVPDELNNYNLAIYNSRINAAIISVPGVANVSNITINGSSNDLVLLQTATAQELPYVGVVSLSG